jgi:hypothetical protein
MEEKKLQAVDNLAFVQGLYDYCGRNFNAQVRKSFAETMGVSEKSFSNKMYSQVGFKGQELDLVKTLYRKVLGDTVYTRLYREFLTNAADGDYRTNEAAKDRAIAELAEQNEGMAVSKILV